MRARSKISDCDFIFLESGHAHQAYLWLYGSPIQITVRVCRGCSTIRLYSTSVCRAPPTLGLAVSVRASYPHRLGDGSNLAVSSHSRALRL